MRDFARDRFERSGARLLLEGLLMAGEPTVPDRRALLSGLLTFAFGLMILSGFADPSIATVAATEGEDVYCVATCVDPAGIRWEEAVVDPAGIRWEAVVDPAGIRWEEAGVGA